MIGVLTDLKTAWGITDDELELKVGKGVLSGLILEHMLSELILLVEFCQIQTKKVLEILLIGLNHFLKHLK